MSDKGSAPDSVRMIEVLSPHAATRLGEIRVFDRRDVEVAISGIRSAQSAWETTGVRRRVAWMHRFRDWLLDHQTEMVELLRAETGKPEAEAVVEFGMSLNLLNYYASRASGFLRDEHPLPGSLLTLHRRLQITYRPYPVVGVMVPWNFPLGLAMFDAVPALLAGAAVVVKPSELTPLTVLRAFQGWREIGAPDVVTVVTGLVETGQAVVDGVDYIQFTGSTRTGRQIGARAAARLIPCGLELGGKDAAVVLQDADLETAARGIAFGALSNTGQMCTSVERVYVVEPNHDEFVRRLVEVVGSLRQPSSATVETDLGVMVGPAQVELVMAQIRDAIDKGATAVLGGGRSGSSVEPTILIGVDHSMDVMRDETFGPVIPVMRVANEAEALRMANDSRYGLSASLWSADVTRAAKLAKHLEVGAVDVNDVSTHLACFPVPQSGWKESGPGGRLGGPAGIRKFCRPQVVTTPRVELKPIQALAGYPYSRKKGMAVDQLLRLTNARGVRRWRGPRGGVEQ